MNEPIDGQARWQEWEDQLNALLDGELDNEGAQRLREAAGTDHQLSQAIIEAYQLQRALANIPLERAPDSLRRKLAAIPHQQAGEQSRQHKPGVWSWWRQPWQLPRWAAAVAAVPVVMITLNLTTDLFGPKEPSAAEIAQAQQELAVALSYLGKVSRRTGLEIGETVNQEMHKTVNENMLEAIHAELEFNKEREL
jgi:anti-sigma-K factor RskA